MVTLVKIGDTYNVPIHDYIMKSSDEKPHDFRIPNGSRAYEMDTGKHFIYDVETQNWLEVK